MRSFPFPGDVLLQWHACELLCHVANASPADYTQLAVKEGALVLVTGAMRGFPAHPQLQAAGCWFLDTCAALQPLHEMLMREHVVSVRSPSCFCFCSSCSCSSWSSSSRLCSCCLLLTNLGWLFQLCCSALRTFPDHSALLLAAFSTIGSLASSRPHHDAIQVRPPPST